MGFEWGKPFLPDIRRIPNDNVESAICEHFRECRLPVKRAGMNCWVSDNAVADPNCMVQAGEDFSASCSLDPQTQAADFDGFLIQVDSKQILLKDLLVRIEQRTGTPQFTQSIIGDFVELVQLVKRFDQKRTAAAGRVQNADSPQFILPCFPKLNQRLFLRFLQRG